MEEEDVRASSSRSLGGVRELERDIQDGVGEDRGGVTEAFTGGGSCQRC